MEFFILRNENVTIVGRGSINAKLGNGLRMDQREVQRGNLTSFKTEDFLIEPTYSVLLQSPFFTRPTRPELGKLNLLL